MRSDGGSLLRRVELLIAGKQTFRRTSVSGAGVAIVCSLLAIVLVSGRISPVHASIGRNIHPRISSIHPSQDQPNKALTAYVRQNGDPVGRRGAEARDEQDSDYVLALRNAGVNFRSERDLRDASALLALGVTPEYANQIAHAGMGIPDAHDLVAIKAMNITPEYIVSLVANGIAPRTFRELAGVKAYNVNADFADALSTLGFGHLDGSVLLRLKQAGISEGYGAWLKKQFPSATIDDLLRSASVHLDERSLNAIRGQNPGLESLNDVLNYRALATRQH